MNVTTDTDALLEQALEAARADTSQESDTRWAFIRELHRRGEPGIFDAAVRWCRAPEPLVRCLGADVLGQLGFAERYPYANASTPVLEACFADSDERVIESALCALGHLDTGSTERVCRLAEHLSADVRRAVAYCLGGRDEQIAHETLIRLSADPDADVRDWATFALGSLSEVDSVEVRNALASRLADENADARGEGMCGLAARGDQRAVSAILADLLTPDASWAIEAVATMPPELIREELEELLREHPDVAAVRAALDVLGSK